MALSIVSDLKVALDTLAIRKSMKHDTGTWRGQERNRVWWNNGDYRCLREANQLSKKTSKAGEGYRVTKKITSQGARDDFMKSEQKVRNVDQLKIKEIYR